MFVIPKDRNAALQEQASIEASLSSLKSVYKPSDYSLYGTLTQAIPVRATDGSIELYFIDINESGSKVTLKLEHVTVEEQTRDSQGNLSVFVRKITRLRPIFFLPSGLTTSWLSFNTDETWLILKVIESDVIAALEIDLDEEDYLKSVGAVTNGKLVYAIGPTFETSLAFAKQENALYYVEENTRKFVKKVMTEIW